MTIPRRISPSSAPTANSNVRSPWPATAGAALRTDWEGTIWVRRRGDEGAGCDPIDLITADGRCLGTFAPGSTALPEAFGPGGLLAFAEADDLDVPFVLVKRWRRPEGVPE